MHASRQAGVARQCPRRVGPRMKWATVKTGHPTEAVRHTVAWPEDDVDDLLTVDDSLDVGDEDDDHEAADRYKG